MAKCLGDTEFKAGLTVAAVVPCYKVADSVVSVLRRMPACVSVIYVVDDACPQDSGAVVESQVEDRRVRVLRHASNRGVGGAMKTGYQQALQDQIDVIVKVDGDGQIDPQLIPQLIQPILDGRADYVKGNRFFALESLSSMPRVRLLGNSVLSFVMKVVSGYWDVMDPTNGFTAIQRKALALLPLSKLDERYFFESDMLFRLSTFRAVVRQVPMQANYGEEESSLHIFPTLLEFPRKYCIRFFKRIFYNYYLRDFNVASLEIIGGTIALIWGFAFGTHHWLKSIESGIPATAGTVILAALPVIVGFQMILAAILYDTANVPREPIHRLLN